MEEGVGVFGRHYCVSTNQSRITGHLEPNTGELVVSTCRSSRSNNTTVDRHSPSPTRPEVAVHRPDLDAPHRLRRVMTGAVTAAIATNSSGYPAH